EGRTERTRKKKRLGEDREPSDDPPAVEDDFTDFNADEQPPKTDAADPQKELVIDEKGDNEQDFDRLLQINDDWADHFNEEHRPSINRIDEESDKKHDAMVNMASRPESLQEYLTHQLAFEDIGPELMEL